jgi:hypothetical protein
LVRQTTGRRRVATGVPPHPECPAICNGGCAEDECQILCTVDAPCRGPIQCPEDFACDVDCAGEDVCMGVQIACPNDYSCALTCEGDLACHDTQLTCGFSECALECGAPTTACEGTIVHCGPGACLGECIPGAFPTLSRCEDACTCERC